MHRYGARNGLSARRVPLLSLNAHALQVYSVGLGTRATTIPTWFEQTRPTMCHNPSTSLWVVHVILILTECCLTAHVLKIVQDRKFVDFNRGTPWFVRTFDAPLAVLAAKVNNGKK